MTHKIKARLEWVELCKAAKNAGFVCRLSRSFQTDFEKVAYYKEYRPHGSLDSKTPWEKCNELAI